ncbi:MAG: hypothetical protein ABI618_05300 [Nitrospirota bacterium]
MTLHLDGKLAEGLLELAGPLPKQLGFLERGMIGLTFIRDSTPAGMDVARAGD